MKKFKDMLKDDDVIEESALGSLFNMTKVMLQIKKDLESFKKIQLNVDDPKSIANADKVIKHIISMIENAKIDKEMKDPYLNTVLSGILDVLSQLLKTDKKSVMDIMGWDKEFRSKFK